MAPVALLSVPQDYGYERTPPLDLCGPAFGSLLQARLAYMLSADLTLLLPFTHCGLITNLADSLFDYRYVMLTALASTFVGIWHGMLVGTTRKAAKVPYPNCKNPAYPFLYGLFFIVTIKLHVKTFSLSFNWTSTTFHHSINAFFHKIIFLHKYYFLLQSNKMPH